MTDLTPTRSASEHIVILGGGFGGWYAARALSPRLPRARITLIDRVDHMLYTPMLTEVAGGNQRAEDICVPMRTLPKRVRFVRGEVTAVDIATKKVTLADGQVFTATQLVFALGSTTAYHGIEGAEESSLSLKTAKDAARILARVDAAIAAAATAPVEQRCDLLRLVVAGGGYTGVETIAAVAEHMRRQAATAGLPSDEVEAVLVESSGRLMEEMPASLAKYSQDLLESKGVRVVLNQGVKQVAGQEIELTGGERMHAGVLLWDTGIEPSPLLKKTGLALGKHHGVVVDECFRVGGHPGIWAIGDCAEIPQPAGGTYGATAQNATREGTHLAQNISAVLHGRSPRPFRFKMLGQLAILSDHRAVAEILGVRLKGVLAWGMWWVIYIAKLPYMQGRVGVVRQLLAPSDNAAANLQPQRSHRPTSAA